MTALLDLRGQLVVDAFQDLVGRRALHECRQLRGHGSVGFTRVQDMPHATTIEMSRRIWDEFFSRFSRVDSSIVYHDKEDS